MIIKKTLTERDKLEYLTHGGRTPLNRRDFLSKTSSVAMTTVMAPTLFGLLTQKLYGQDSSCPDIGISGVSIGIPYTEYHAAGGGAFGECFIGLDQGGLLLPSYKEVGVPDEDHPSISGVDRSLGLALHPNSAFLRGFNERLTQLGKLSIKDNIAGISAAVESRSDSSNNQLSGVHMPSWFGVKGAITMNIGSQAGRDSGGRHELAQGTRNPLAAPVAVSNAQAASEIGGRGSIASALSEDAAFAIRSAMSNMSRERLSRFNGLSTEQQARVLVDCGYINSVQLPDLFNPSLLDPRQNSDVTNNFRDANSNLAALFHLTTAGYVGAGAVQGSSNYDNHNGTAVDPYNTRMETGRRFAEMFAAASDRGVPLALTLLTDGHMGTVKNDGVIQFEDVGGGILRARRPGDSDRLGGTQAFFVYIPGKTKSDILRNTGQTQIGWFKSDGTVDSDSSLAASSPSMAAMAFFTNWLALFGRESEIALLNRGQNPFASDIEKYILFKKVT